MPKSKPPRRRYRPLRRVNKVTERAMTIYDKLEEVTEKLHRQIEPFLDQIPARERTLMLTLLADNRAQIAGGRADILQPSATPVLDELLRQDAERRRKARLTPPPSPVFSGRFA